MIRDSFEPRIAVREERRQANEALGRSFCKTLAELATNSDSSGKRKHGVLTQTSGLVDLMLRVPKGNHLDTSALKSQLAGKQPKRRIVIELVTAKGHGRAPREIVVVDDAQGMSAQNLKTALEDIGGDRRDLAGGMTGRNLFGRGLSDVLRAHQEGVIQTFDGSQLTIANGEWSSGKTGRWTIHRERHENPGPKQFKDTHLSSTTSGTAVRFVAGCRIPDHPGIVSRLANFFMLRLIAADPNIEFVLRQFRAGHVYTDPVIYDFPVGPVIESFSRTFDPGGRGEALKVDFLLARSDRKLEGVSADREARENGLLVVDDLDAVYDLTFVDPDYERAEFLRHVFGVIRINGLRAVLEQHLNVDFTSPLRVDREGFNREHEFSKALLEFLAEELRPAFERERKRVEEREHSKFSEQTRKKIEDALKHLNKFFQQITEKTGPGSGGEDDKPEPPSEPVSFFPQAIKLTAGRPRKVLLLVRDDMVSDGCVIVANADDGITVQPETETIYRKQSPRWPPHPNYFGFTFIVSATAVGLQGEVKALVEGMDGKDMDAKLRIEDVLDEPVVSPPTIMEFRPQTSMGRPNRRNNLVLFVNPSVVTPGHYVRFAITKRLGSVDLVDEAGNGVQQFDVKLDANQHGLRGQNVLRVLVPWRGTAWNQHATVEARTKIGPDHIVVPGYIRLDEPDPNDAGFFREVKYDELDGETPSQYAAGVITINTLDPLNKIIFGAGDTKDETRKEFDRRLSEDPKAQQRLASILLEEASFTALQQLYNDNKLLLSEKREVAEVHAEVDRYKFRSAVDVYRALVR